MTTFQDPPPQSRRAVRASERGETSAPTPDQGIPYTFDAAADPQQQPQVPVAPHHTGRRAQLPQSAPPRPDGAQSQPGFEPLNYSTQGRVAPPVGEQSAEQPLAAAPAPGTDTGGFRVRDFSPEGGRRAAPPREQVASPLATPGSFPAPPRPVDLDYHTQGQPAQAAHSAATPPPPEDSMNHTLSRRELRELRAAEEARVPALQMPESIDTILNSGPIEIPTLAPPPGQSQALAEAMAEFDMLTRARREAEVRARDAQVASLATPIVLNEPPMPVSPVPVASVPVASVPVASVPVASVPIASVPVPQATVAEEPASDGLTALFSAPEAPDFVAASPAEPVAVDPDLTDAVLADPIFTEPVFSAPVFESPAFSQPPAARQPESAPELDPEAYGGRSPRASNHWRVQAAIQDEDLPYENTLSRTVGSNTSAITTSALVLPSVPQPDGMLASLNATGEILVTGSINLPRSLGATGAHPDRVDHSDDEDDPFDSQVAAPDSAPVRAIRAVSTSTSTRGVIETKRPQGNRMLTVVIAVASVLCVGLVGLLVFALATGKL
jgi:hypothetical protein